MNRLPAISPANGNKQFFKAKGATMPKTTTMDQLFLDEIRDLYDAEKQLTKALPKMAKAASSDDLRMAFEGHLEETQGHVKRLEEIFEALGEKGAGKKCTAMQGLIKEGDELMEMDQSALRDAGLIAAAQKVEHYEISGYGSARTHAQLIGNSEAVSLLDETLSEEKEADRKLNDLAENTINSEALEVSGTEATMKVRRTGAKTRTAGN
jgi:ferritin-like metal-binding protein YciE